MLRITEKQIVYLDKSLVNNCRYEKIFVARNLGQVSVCWIEEIRYSQLLQRVVQQKALLQFEFRKVNLDTKIGHE